jgi:hypothetical protein
MEERNQQPTEAIKDIRQMMERSSRFISLSGLSGIAAGACAITGAWVADRLLKDYYLVHGYKEHHTPAIDTLTVKLLGVGAGVFVLALLLSFLLTWQRAKKLNLPVWDHTSRRLLWNLLVPIIAGGLFILGMLHYGEWLFVAPACLIFYGLGLINGSKYTWTDIRYLGYLEIILGATSMWCVGYGLLFWAIGFGVLHIVYGALMWWKYERSV